jgi:hypothetical protein
MKNNNLGEAFADECHFKDQKVNFFFNQTPNLRFSRVLYFPFPI